MVWFSIVAGVYCGLVMIFFLARLSRKLLVCGIRAPFLISLLFLPIVLGRAFLVGQGQRALAWG